MNKSWHHHIITSSNELTAHLIVESLYRQGIIDICIAPGSRSAPLVLAIAKRESEFNLYTHLDERSLGFFALGLAKSKQKPVAIIVTSGTAVANLLPACIEAAQSHVPLLLLTADRPPELIACGANQSIDQFQIFGVYAHFFNLIPLNILPDQAGYLLQMIDRSIIQARQSNFPSHLNLMWREPLYPTASSREHKSIAQILMQDQALSTWMNDDQPYLKTIGDTQKACKPASNQALLESLLPIKKSIQQAQKPFMLIGENQGAYTQQLIDAINIPFIADIGSGFRLNALENQMNFSDISFDDPSFSSQLNETDYLIQIGGQFVSQPLLRWINQYQGDLLLISSNYQNSPHHRATWINDDEGSFLLIELAKDTLPQSHQNWTQICRQINLQYQIPNLTEQAVFTEDNLVLALSDNLPKNTNLFCGNSMSIRLLNRLAQTGSDAQVFTQRGASGIDGLIASIMGIAMGQTSATTALIGDLSFLYDLNALLMASSLKWQAPCVIIILNNFGGGIFNKLPIAQLPEYRQTQSRFFNLKHTHNLSIMAEALGCISQQVNSLPAFINAYQQAHQTLDLTIIEAQIT